jgi:flagellar biosynthesis/type III secretory pathway M-ring protein FliF/YscJ
MDVVKSQLERIRQQLAGLTATQRMLVGTLVAVMVLTLLYWGKYAGSPEMVPVLDQALNEDEIGRIDMALQAKDIPHTVSGGKVLVPAERKMEIVADLMFTQQLPHQTQNAFVEMSKQLNIFSGPTQTEATYNQATQMTLAQVIRHFPGVADAQVIINAKMERRIENSIMPTATVVITMRDPTNQGNKQLVAAAADGVTGAVAGLKRGSVNVIINGRSHHVADLENNSMASDDLNDLRQGTEEHEEQKILALFSYINGLTATVSCDVENRSLMEHKRAVDSVLVKPQKEENHSEENAAPSAPASDPGVGANTAASIASVGSASGGGGGGSTMNDDKTENNFFPSTTDLDTQTPAGKVTVVSATVRVPRSYIVGMLKQENPNAKEPDDATVQAKAKIELASIREGVRSCIGMKSLDMLSVDTYTDVAGSTIALQLAATATTPAGGASVASVTAYGKEIAIGVLAVVSLFMMSSMVKKSTPAPLVAAPVTHEPPPVLVAGEGLAGEAGTTDQTLAGMELDEDAVHAQQMLEQVTTMVKENPDGAASLVKRWLNRS